MNAILRRTLFCGLLFSAAISALGQTTDISSTPSSLSFQNTYIGKASGSKVLTINNLTTSGQIIIQNISFTCPGFGISSGVAPFTLGQTQKLTHYSIFFQPTVAQTYSCNFVLSLNDGTSLNVPISGTGLSSSAVASVSPSTLKFPNQTVGTTSAPQTVTITNTGSSSLTLNTITTAPPSFTTSAVTLPYTINAGASLPISVYYTPGQVSSENGALDFTYSSVPDNGTSLLGNGVAASVLTVSTPPTLPQATQNAAYQATLTAAGGTGPYSWSLASGSLPLGLSLSSAGIISGTLDSSVAVGNYSFTVQATDSSSGLTASSKLTLGVLANLGDNCNDISFNVPNTTTAMVALTDLGTGTYQGYQAGLYPNGSNVRPSAHDSDGVALALGIQPLDANGNPSPTGKYVLLAVGESTAQNEFNRFLPIANADPAKNPNLVLVNGAQGGATPNNFTSTTSVYWATTLNNYLPQNGVTANQVVAIWMEDTDGIASGTFPSDISTMQSEYETIMQTMHTLFPNLKLIYFSSRVYGGYSNGVGSPANPEPYAYETSYAVKWAIQDQLNGNANLNYNAANGPVVAPWMAWGPYYWSNGMLGRNDGLVWDCADFSADGTHPSSAYGQLKVATALLNFLKTDDTTIPWYLAPSLALTATGGNNQTGNIGTTLPVPLTVLASNLNGGAGQSGVTVTFSDGGAGGTFSNPSPTSDSSGNASTNYTLPSTGKTVTISATSAGYASATFTEIANSNIQLLGVSAGNNQVGAPGSVLPQALTVQATLNGNPAAGITVTFADGGVGGVFGSPTAITDSNGLASTSYTLPATAQAVTISATSAGYSSASFSETATNIQVISVTSGNNQTAGVGTTLPTALGVLATLNGNPVPGLVLTFSDGGVGGTFSNPTATTDANGLASSTYTLPSTAQTVTITVSGSGYTSATFTQTAVVDSLVVNAGNNQNGNVSTTLPTALAVVATTNGTPVAGLNVTFDDAGAGGILGSPTAVTDSNGVASTTYTLPSTAETVTITASSSGYTPATFTEIAAIQLLATNAGNNQAGNVGTTLPTSLAVQATSNGNPVAGVSVTFNDGGAGGSFGTPTANTDSNGIASSTYTLPSTAKTVGITVSALGYTSASFTETAGVLVLAATSGNNQSGPAGNPLLTPLTVTATNNGNPVSGLTVTFSDNGAGGTFGTPTATTGSAGTASTTYSPASVGTFTITASASGYGPVSFTETGTAGVSTLTTVSGGKQSGTVGTTLPLAIVIKAKNSTGGAVAGASISFSDGSTGTFSPNPAVTGSNGQASTSYTLPKVPKTYTITASDGAASVRVTETAVVGPPTTFTIAAGNNQTASPNTTLAKQLSVKLTDQYNNPISGATVTFTDNGAGGVLSAPTTTTNKNGQASTSYTTGPTTGTVTITASTAGVASLNFKETVK